MTESGAFCIGCGKDGAEMQCPKCKELGLGLSLFCSQECFKANWKEHKKMHKALTADGLKRTMSEKKEQRFKFTGKLRPGRITPKREVPAVGKDGNPILRPDYADDPEGFPASEEQVITSTKVVKWSGEKLEKIKRVAALSREVLDEVLAAVKPGVTTDYLDEVGHKACVSRDMYPSPLNYRGFPKSLCTSLNEVICHGIPDTTVLQEGDIINIDVSCYKDGYHGDLNETVFVGRPKPEDQDRLVKLVHCAWVCMMEGIKTVKPGELWKEIGNNIQPVADRNGYSSVRSVCGHGIGALFHTAPDVLHYAGNRTPGTMREGHVFTIEPMLNEGTWHDIMWPDNWTMTTKDGGYSAQFEHTMVCGPNGAEILTPNVGGTPFYQKQLAEWGIELPALAEEEWESCSDDEWESEDEDEE